MIEEERGLMDDGWMMDDRWMMNVWMEQGRIKTHRGPKHLHDFGAKYKQQ